MIRSCLTPSRAFFWLLSIGFTFALVACSSAPEVHHAEDGATVPEVLAAETGPATDAARPVTRVSEKPTVFALPDAERLPPSAPRWMTPVSLPVQIFEPPAAYRPVTEPEARRYVLPELPTVQNPSSLTDESTSRLAPKPSTASPVFESGMAPAAPLPSTDFTSTDFDDNAANTDGFLSIPADPIAAAGPNHVLNVVNVTLRVHEKDGTLLVDTALDDFFASLSPDTFTFDPKVVFDHHAGRWLVVTLERLDDGSGGSPEESKIFVAVSDDADPLGTWFQIAIDAKTNIGGTDHWADYPGFAVDEEAVYITANMFEFAADGFDFGGVRLWVLGKGLGSGGFYDGGSLTAAKFDPYAGGGIPTTTQPAQIYGDAPADVGTFLVSYSGISDTMTSTEAVQVVRIDNPLSSPTFTLTFVDFGDVEDLAAALPGAPQSGTSTLVETNDRRALHSVWHADSLWLTATIDPKTGDPDSGEATAYWWELDTTDLSLLTVADQGTVLGDDIANDTFTFFPSIAVNGIGQVAIGFSGSASSIFPGSFYTTREPGDPAGTTSGSATLFAGADSYIRTFCGRNRWGDYSGVAVDPVDGCFWVYNKHAIATGTTTSIDCDGDGSDETIESGRWSTGYGKVCLSGACPPDMLLASIDLTGTQIRKAGVNLRTVEDVTVKTSADVTFRAGSRIVLGDGFSVEGGASFTAEITGSPCS